MSKHLPSPARIRSAAATLTALSYARAMVEHALLSGMATDEICEALRAVTAAVAKVDRDAFNEGLWDTNGSRQP